MNYKFYQSIVGGEDDCYDGKRFAKEKNSIITITTPTNNQIVRIKFDGCVIKSREQQRCDYIFININSGNYYFTELKGSIENLQNAYQQIISSFSQLQNLESINYVNIYGIIIFTSRISKVPSQTWRGLMRDFKKYGKDIYKVQSGKNFMLK